jgi:hypothetical protein
MPKPLRQSIEIPVGDGSISLEVTFKILELVERVYDLRADFVKVVLQSERMIKRSDIAVVMMGWIDSAGVKVDREQVFEDIITAPEKVIRKYVGAIQGAVMYSLREISEDELKKLADGEDIRQDKSDEGEDGGKKNSDSDPTD